MKDLAPVVAFAYKRRDHVERMLVSLAADPLAARTRLIVYCDGPKQADDAEAVAGVRRSVRGARGFADIAVVERPANLGLARSIISGVGEVLADHGRAIVVEDDLLLSPHFLRYMKDGLALYAERDEVASIHGYAFPVDVELPETFFLRGADCLKPGSAAETRDLDANNTLPNLDAQGEGSRDHGGARHDARRAGQLLVQPRRGIALTSRNPMRAVVGVPKASQGKPR